MKRNSSLYFRLEPFSLREKRLLYRQPVKTIEVVASQTIEACRDPSGEALQKLKEQITKLTPEEKGTFYESLEEGLRKLNTVDREHIAQSIMRKEFETHVRASGMELDALRNAVEASKRGITIKPPEGTSGVSKLPEDHPKETEEAGKEKSTKGTSVWENVRKWPWENVAVGAVALTVAVGTVAFFRWLFSGGKKVKDAAVAKSKGWLGWLGWGLAAGGLAFAGYTGWKWLEGRLKPLADGMEKARKEAEELQNKLASAEEAGRRAVEKIDEKGQEVLATVTAGVTSEENQERAKAAADEAAEIAKQKMLPEAIVRMMEGPRFLGGTSIRTRSIHLSFFIERSSSAGAKMGDVFSCFPDIENSDAHTIKPPLIVTIEGDRETKENREYAADLFMRFCRQHRLQVLSNVMATEGLSEEEAIQRVNTMTIHEYIERVMASFGAIAAVALEMEKGEGSLYDRVKHLDLAKHVAADEDLHRKIYEFATEDVGLTVEELEELSTFDIIKLTLSVDKFGADVESAAHAQIDASSHPNERLLSYIFKQLYENEKYAKCMLPAFHGVYPTSEKSDPLELMKLYLHHRMPLDKAVRLFLYVKMMEDGNPAGLALMQLEIVKYIADEDAGWFLQPKKVEVVTKITEELLSQSAEDLSKAWQETGIIIPPDVFERALPILKTVLGYGAIAVKEWYTTWLEIVWGILNQHKKQGVAIVAGGVFLHRLYVTQRMNPYQIKHKLESWRGNAINRSPLGRGETFLRKFGTPLFISQSEDIKKCAGAYKEIYGSIEHTFQNTEKLEELMEYLRRAATSTHNKNAWADLASQLRAHGLEDAAKRADMFRSNVRMRTVLHRALFHSGGWFECLGLKKPIFLTSRALNAGFDATIGRLLYLPKYLCRVQSAINTKDITLRIGRYKTLLEEGMHIDELLIAGANAEDLLPLAKSTLGIDDLLIVYANLLPDQKVKHAWVLADVLAKRGPLELADAGCDLAEFSKAMRTANAEKAGTFALNIIDDMEALAKDARYLAPIMEEIASVGDDAIRIGRLKNYMDLLGDDAALIRMGARASDLLSCGRTPAQIVSTLESINDVAIRQSAFADLLQAGRGEEVLNAIPHGSPLLDDFRAVEESYKTASESVRGTAAAVEITEELLDDALKAARGADGSIDVGVLLSKLGYGEDVSAIILKSAKMGEAVRVAAESKDLLRLQRAIRAVEGVRAMRGLAVGLNGLAAIGDVAAIVMAGYEIEAMQEKQKLAQETGNVTLEEIHKIAERRVRGERIAAYGSLGLQVSAILGEFAAGASATSALSISPLRLVALAAAVILTGTIGRGAHAAAEEWLSEAEDWVQRIPPGEMLQMLKDLESDQSKWRPFTREHWERYFATDSSWNPVDGSIVSQGGRAGVALVGEMFKADPFIGKYSPLQGFDGYKEWADSAYDRIKDTRTTTRGRLMEAYVIVMTPEHCPPVEGESDEEYKDRLNQFRIDQMTFLGSRTNGDYRLSDGLLFDEARMYARLMGWSRDLKEQNASWVIEWDDARGNKSVFDLKDFADTHMTDDGGGKLSQLRVIAGSLQLADVSKAAAADVLARSSLKQAGTALKVQLLREVEYDVQRAAANVTNENFTAAALWGEGKAERMVRYLLMRQVMATLNGEAERLSKVSASGPVSTVEYNKSLMVLRGILRENPDALFQRSGGNSFRYYGSKETTDKELNASLLIVDSLLQRIVAEDGGGQPESGKAAA